MDRGKRNEEIRKSIQIVILLCYSLYSVGLAAVSVINKWEFWAVPIIFIGAVISWSLYVSGQFVFRFRIYVFAGFVALSTFFYGSHVEELYNATLIMVLAMLLFSLTEEKPALRIFFMAYVMLLIYHLILMLTGVESFSQLSGPIMFLDIVSVIIADRIGGYICEMFSVSKSMAVFIFRISLSSRILMNIK